MYKLILSVFILLLLASTSFAQVGISGGVGYSGILGGGVAAAADYTSLNATAATESDEGSDITITSATKVSWTDLRSRNDTGYVYHDMGAGFFSGDFTIRFQTKDTVFGDLATIAHMMLTKKVADLFGIDAGTAEDDDAVVFFSYRSGSTYSHFLRILEDGAAVSDSSSYTVATDTVYYVTIKRDDDAGTNSTGQITAYICTTDYCVDGANLQDTLVVNCSAGEQNDFQYIYWVATNDNNANTNASSGYTEDLKYKLSLP